MKTKKAKGSHAVAPTLAVSSLFVLLVAAALPVNGQPSSHPESPHQSTVTTRPRSDRDACLVNKDHDSCQRYYRSLCLNQDASGCRDYANELSKDCPKPDDKTVEDAVAKRCALKIQCWQDRALSLTLMSRACAEDPHSASCADAKRDVQTAVSCDSIVLPAKEVH